MRLEQGKFCPLIKKDCIEHKCNLYITLTGIDNDNGKFTEKCSCVVTSLPLLITENSQYQKENSASIEKFRNAVVATNDKNKNLYHETQKIENLSQNKYNLLT